MVQSVQKGGDGMAESKLRELSTDFAVKIIKLCEKRAIGRQPDLSAIKL